MAEISLISSNDGWPSLLIPNIKDKVITFESYGMVMENDTLIGPGWKGTIKEVLEERPARGIFEEKGLEIPTFFKVQLY